MKKVRCANTEQYCRMFEDSEKFIHAFSAKSAPDFDAEEIDNFIDQYNEICQYCQTAKAKYIHDKVRQAGKIFRYRKHSPYLNNVGQTTPGHCTGSYGKPSQPANRKEKL